MAMIGLHLKLGLVASTCALLAAISINAAFSVSLQIWLRGILGILGIIFLSVSLIYAWVLSKQPCPRQSLRKVTEHLLFVTVLRVFGKHTHTALLKSCEDPMKHQKRLWQEIWKKNGRTAYATDNGLANATSLEKLRKLHPLNNYEPFRPYVDRMLEGEENVLVDGSADTFIRTTGTTGKSKYIPIKNKAKVMMKVGILWVYVTHHQYPKKPLSKCLHLFVNPKIQRTNHGARIEPVATMPEDKDWVFAPFSTPPAGYRISSMHEAFYVQLLFNLFDPEVGTVLCGFLHFVESSMKLLEGEWKNLTRDVELGTINPELNLEPAIRESLSRELQRYGADPARAFQLRVEFEKGFEGIIKRIWPRINVIMSVDSTGSWPRMKDTYAKGVDLLTVSYGCSEANLGVSPGPKYINKGYIPLVQDTIMEFIKEDDMSLADPPTFFLDEVEKDQNYEVVVTQRFGLYRYRIGDVVRVIDYYKNMPVIDFIYRTGQMLNLRYEKLDQRVVLDGIRAATSKWSGRTLIEFAVAESTFLTEESSIYEADQRVPYYIFFLEMKDPGQPLTDEQKNMIDVELQSRNSDVDRLRREGAVDSPRVHLVRPGAFGELEKYILANTGATANQYKVPRKLRTHAMLNIMVDNIIQ